jgi:hypothetical protein
MNNRLPEDIPVSPLTKKQLRFTFLFYFYKGHFQKLSIDFSAISPYFLPNLPSFWAGNVFVRKEEKQK